jgi:hypothetical protein
VHEVQVVVRWGDEGRQDHVELIGFVEGTS